MMFRKLFLNTKGNSIVTFRWIYKINHAHYGSNENYKAIFVSTGFSHKEGIDYDDTFSHVLKYTMIRSIISCASILGWKFH